MSIERFVIELFDIPILFCCFVNVLMLCLVVILLYRVKTIEDLSSQTSDDNRPWSMNSRPNSRHQKSHKLERGYVSHDIPVNDIPCMC